MSPQSAASSPLPSLYSALLYGLALTVALLLFELVPSDAPFLQTYARLAQWDTGWYENIAVEGYHDVGLALVRSDLDQQKENVAFFPAYPLSAHCGHANRYLNCPGVASLSTTGMLGYVYIHPSSPASMADIAGDDRRHISSHIFVPIGILSCFWLFRVAVLMHASRHDILARKDVIRVENHNDSAWLCHVRRTSAWPCVGFISSLAHRTGKKQTHFHFQEGNRFMRDDVRRVIILSLLCVTIRKLASLL